MPKQVLISSGKKPSEVLKQMQHVPRFRICMIWVDSQKQVLNQRLDQRVDDMVKRGLVKEVEELRAMNIFGELNMQEDHTKGVFQAIGYKEFCAYLDCQNERQKQELLEQCLQKLKTQTKRYCKAQIGWITHRFLTRTNIHKLDTSNPSEWKSQVLEPALLICKAFLQSQTIQDEETLIPQTWILRKTTPLPDQQVGEWKKFVCQICNRELNGQKEWEVHLKSNQHRQTRKKLKKMNESKLSQPPLDTREDSHNDFPE